MSCRSTAGGRAACMHATMLGVPSADQSHVLHDLVHRYEERHPEATEDADVSDVLDYYDRLDLHARNLPDVSQTRRERLLALTEMARQQVADGVVPSRATLAAWQDLPAAGQPAQREASNRPYHRRFTNFDRRTLDATDALFSSRPSRLTQEERDVVFRRWVEEVSDVYGMEPPTFRWDEEADMGGGGFYSPHDHSITMSRNHPSVTTLMHEFRHALQGKGAGAKQIDPDVEVDARAWSLSLYHQVRPALFDRMVRAGRLFHITAADLDR